MVYSIFVPKLCGPPSLFFRFGLYIRYLLGLYNCNQKSRVYKKIFFCSVPLYCHASMISPAGYVFYFGYNFCQLVGIASLSVLGLRNFFEFLSFSVFSLAGVCKRFFLLTNILFLGLDISG